MKITIDTAENGCVITILEYNAIPNIINTTNQKMWIYSDSEVLTKVEEVLTNFRSNV